MKVVGRYKTVYEYELSGKIKDADGTAYPVKSRSGCKVKMLDKAYCTKAKEQEINSAMINKTVWHGQKILDMVYSHGKFAGIVVEQEKPAAPPPVQPPAGPTGGSGYTGAPVPPYNRKPQPPKNPRSSASGADEILEKTVIKILYTALLALGMSVLVYAVLFEVYLSSVAAMFSEAVADNCYTFNFSGFTGIIGGLAGMGLAIKFTWDSDWIKYYIFQPVGYLLGMLAAFVVVTVLILLVRMAYSLFIALIPVLLIIGAIIYVLKTVVGGRK